jgi:hypothetical protein
MGHCNAFKSENEIVYGPLSELLVIGCKGRRNKALQAGLLTFVHPRRTCGPQSTHILNVGGAVGWNSGTENMKYCHPCNLDF